jgi:hypothetical protein
MGVLTQAHEGHTDCAPSFPARSSQMQPLSPPPHTKSLHSTDIAWSTTAEGQDRTCACEKRGEGGRARREPTRGRASIIRATLRALLACSACSSSAAFLPERGSEKHGNHGKSEMSKANAHAGQGYRCHTKKRLQGHSVHIPDQACVQGSLNQHPQ